MNGKGPLFLFSFWLLYGTYLMEAHVKQQCLQCFGILFCFHVAL